MNDLTRPVDREKINRKWPWNDKTNLDPWFGSTAHPPEPVIKRSIIYKRWIFQCQVWLPKDLTLKIKVMLLMKTALNCYPFQWIKFECSLYRLPWLTRLQPKIWSSWGQKVEMLVAVHCFKNMLAIKQSSLYWSSSVTGSKCPLALPILSSSASWTSSREVDHLKCWLYGAYTRFTKCSDRNWCHWCHCSWKAFCYGRITYAVICFTVIFLALPRDPVRWQTTHAHN